MHALNFQALEHLWSAAVATALALVVKPLLAATGMSGIVTDQSGMAELLVLGFVQLFFMGVVFWPLEKFAPAERWSNGRYARVDRTHAFINLLGIAPFGTYFVFVPLGDAIGRLMGQDSAEPSWHLGHLVPWLNGHPLVLFLIYFVILDFAAWVMHRLQHRLGWWWAIHSLHHSQRQMNRWTDDRGNIVDTILQEVFIAAWGLVIGVPPVDYGLIAFFGTMIEKLSHANTRITFGPVFDKLLVDPRFHRQHHMRADPENPNLHNCNFSFVFPIWDILFRTALYDGRVRPTGLDDPEMDADNMKGWYGQQVASTARLLRALRVLPKRIETPTSRAYTSVR
jgi:sterol desaturase/sphingolipid hydroxylase (fatty acid hydroxylase superfamily)